MKRETTRTSSSSSSLAPKLVVIAIAVVLIAVIALAVIWSMGYVDSQTKEQGAYTLRESIESAAVECYAIEGQYPSSVEYLVDNYGISINDTDYDVTYEVFASNVPPTVKVQVR